MSEAPEGQDAFNLYDAPGHLIRRVQQIHTAVFSEVVAQPDLTTPQFAMLSALHHTPDINQVRLAEELGIDRSTTADVANRLEERGLIRRHRDPADGRRNVLALTAAGEERYRTILPRVVEVGNRLIEPLSAREQVAFLDQLARIVRPGPA